MTYFRAFLAAAFLVLFSGTNGQAATVNYSLNTVISCCGSGPFGTVTVTEIAGGLQIDAQLNTGYLFVHGGQDATFGFSLNGINSVTFQSVSSSWAAVSNSTGDLHLDGAGTFDYGLVAPGKNASQASASSLSFKVLASGLTIANLIASTGSSVAAIFAADIGQCADGTCASNQFAGNGTGFVATTGPDVSAPPLTTPLPAALPLLASALAGLVAICRRRTWAQGRRSAAFAPA